LVAISAWQPEVHGRGVLRLVVVLCGTTAFGAIHVIAESAIMIRFSDANWDSPPGTGYLTVAVITISAIVTAIMPYVRHREVGTMSLRQTPVQGRLPSLDAAKDLLLAMPVLP